MRVAPCLRVRGLYSCSPVFILCGRVCCLACLFLVFLELQAVFVALAILAFIVIFCDDFSLCILKGLSPCIFSLAARFASSSAVSLPCMSMCPGTHSMWNVRFGLCQHSIQVFMNVA